jgi:serine/threonine protein kinase
MIVGTPYFMSPEQLRGEKLDGRSDLFSLAALLYSLLTGRPPFGGSELASIGSQVLYKDPVPPSELVPGIPPGLDGVMTLALMKSADDRHASAAELVDELVWVRQGKAPRRAPPLGLRTQVQRPESFASSSAPPAAPPGTPGPAARIERLGGVSWLRTWVLRHLRMIAAVTVLKASGRVSTSGRRPTFLCSAPLWPRKTGNANAGFFPELTADRKPFTGYRRPPLLVPRPRFPLCSEVVLPPGFG